MAGLYQNNVEWQVISETHAAVILSEVEGSREATESSVTGFLDFAWNDVYMRC